MSNNRQTLAQSCGHFKSETQKPDDGKDYTLELDVILSGEKRIKSYQTTWKSAAALRLDPHVPPPDQSVIATIQAIESEMNALTEHWHNLTRKHKEEWSDWALEQLDGATEALDSHTSSKKAFLVSHPSQEDYDSPRKDAETDKKTFRDAWKSIEDNQELIEGCLDFTEHSVTAESVLTRKHQEWKIAIRDLKDTEEFGMDRINDVLDDIDMET